MILPNIETFIGCESSFEEASIVLYGAPFDSTTSFRPGARFGPSAMRHESFGLETYSPYQDKDLMDISVFDSGDLELCFGSSEMALSDIEKRAEEILGAGKFPLLLGGEHLVTLAAVRAVAAKYPDLHIIHFDAHAMKLWEMAISISSVSEAERGKNFSLLPDTQIFIRLLLKDWKRPSEN